MRFDWKFAAWTGFFLLLSAGAQFLRFPYLVKGVLVTMSVYLATALANPVGGFVVAVVAGWAAGTLGGLRPELLPVGAYLAAGNVVLVVVYSLLRPRSESLGVVLGAAARFLLISAAAMYILKLDPRLRLSLGFPELLAAVAGGLLAGILRGVGRAVCRRRALCAWGRQ